jgi:hypothetical protein
LPQRLLDQRQVRNRRDVDILFDISGFFFQTGQALDRLRLDARVAAEK